MMVDTKEVSKIDTETLVKIWSVLEVLTVSLDRLGHLWLAEGEDPAKNALLQFMGPAMSQQISAARTAAVLLLERVDPSIIEHIEALTANEAAMGYWQGLAAPDPAPELPNEHAPPPGNAH